MSADLAAMTIQDARVVLQQWFCGCGSPELAVARVRDVLRLCPLYEHHKELDALLPDDGFQYLILYMLDHLDLIEHGGSIGGSWLTDKGRRFLAALDRESADEFASLTCANVCIHGFADDEGPHECR